MTISSLSIEQVIYRVAIVLPNSKQVLAESDGHSHRLPTITVRCWARIAEELTTNVRARWDLQTVMLTSLAPSGNDPGLAILEALSWDNSYVGIGLVGIHAEWLSSDIQTRKLLQDVLTGNAQPDDPLARLGWIHECKKWLQTNVTDHEIRFADGVRQLNAGSGFVLVRFGVSEGPAYWVKAVGVPNQREAAITQALFRYSPTYLPPIIAFHQTWNAWAMEEFGSALTDSVDVGTMQGVAVTLARLQQQTINHRAEFIGCGCGDQKVEALRECMPHFLDSLVRIISDAPVEGWERGISTILPMMRDTLAFALDEMDRSNIPSTINNNDMKLANILFDGKRCVFTDWCHAYWGDPFITFQHLHIYLSRYFQPLSRPFQKAYSEAWDDHLSERQIGTALMYSPIIAPYAYLCAWGATALFSGANAPHRRRIFRNIARRILVASEQLKLREGRIHA